VNTKTLESSVGISSFYKHIKQDRKILFWYSILFGGDRGLCCDEVVVVEIDGNIVSMASIAPKGEDQSSSMPTIVGLYTLPKYRKNGFGKDVLQRAIERCIERGFERIRIDAMTTGAMKTISSLPEELKPHLEVWDMSEYTALMPE